MGDQAAAGSAHDEGEGLLFRFDSGVSHHIREPQGSLIFISGGNIMLNHIVIMGRMTRDPELRRTASGTAVASFTLAVDRDFAPKDGGDRETDFIDCVAWRSTGEFVSKYFAKGRMAVVSGRLLIRPWMDKDGNNRRSAEVIVENIYFGDSRRAAEAPEAIGTDYVDDLPLPDEPF